MAFNVGMEANLCGEARYREVVGEGGAFWKLTVYGGPGGGESEDDWVSDRGGTGAVRRTASCEFRGVDEWLEERAGIKLVIDYLHVAWVTPRVLFALGEEYGWSHERRLYNNSAAKWPVT